MKVSIKEFKKKNVFFVNKQPPFCPFNVHGHWPRMTTLKRGKGGIMRGQNYEGQRLENCFEGVSELFLSLIVQVSFK